MRAAAALVAVALGGTGCFASWATVQLTGTQRYLEEGAREVAVPLPEVSEQLAVSMPLAIEHEPQATAAAPVPKPFAIGCEATQHARDQVYRSAFRYGKMWKTATAAFFAAEAAIAAAYYISDREAPERRLAAIVLGVDALGTAALFFAPRKEIYRVEQRPVTSRVRGDCPDGLALDVGGEVFPIDAAGRIDELGLAAIDAWMQSPGAPIRVTYAGRTADVPIGVAEQCAWNRAHHPKEAERLAGCLPGGGPSLRFVGASLEVPMGTLTRIEAVAAP